MNKLFINMAFYYLHRCNSSGSVNGRKVRKYAMKMTKSAVDQKVKYVLLLEAQRWTFPINYNKCVKYLRLQREHSQSMKEKDYDLHLKIIKMLSGAKSVRVLRKLNDV